jgi:hypothetical protein
MWMRGSNSVGVNFVDLLSDSITWNITSFMQRWKSKNRFRFNWRQSNWTVNIVKSYLSS